MKHSRFSDRVMVLALRQGEAGMPVSTICRRLGMSEGTFYVWRRKYGQLSLSELRRLRRLEEENSRLKRLLAGLALDRHRLSKELRKTV